MVLPPIAPTPRDEPTAPFVSHIDALAPAKPMDDSIATNDADGVWEADLLDCCSSVDIALYACCLPCIAVGSSMQRIGLSSGSVALAMFVLIVGMITLYVLGHTQGRWETYSYGRYRANTDEAYEANDDYLFGAIACVVAYVTVVGRARNLVRRHSHIPGDYLDDCCAAVFCACCTVAQVYAHTDRMSAAKQKPKYAVATLPAYNGVPQCQQHSGSRAKSIDS